MSRSQLDVIQRKIDEINASPLYRAAAPILQAIHAQLLDIEARLEATERFAACSKLDAPVL